MPENLEIQGSLFLTREYEEREGHKEPRNPQHWITEVEVQESIGNPGNEKPELVLVCMCVCHM